MHIRFGSVRFLQGQGHSNQPQDQLRQLNLLVNHCKSIYHPVKGQGHPRSVT